MGHSDSGRDVQGFRDWQNQEFLSDAVKGLLGTAEALYVPLINYRNYEKPVFHVNSSEYYKYIQDNIKDYNIAIAINPDDYLEIALHSRVIRLGKWVAKSVVVPVIVGLTVTYVNNIVKYDDKDTEVEFEMVIDDSTETNVSKKSISYSGPADGFEEELLILVKNLDSSNLEEDQDSEQTGKEGHSDEN